MDYKSPESYQKTMKLLKVLETLGISRDATLHAQVKLTHLHISHMMNLLYRPSTYSTMSRQERFVEFIPKVVSAVMVFSFYFAVAFGIYHLIF